MFSRLYKLVFTVYTIAWLHFMSERLIFKSSRFTRGPLSSMTISSRNLRFVPTTVCKLTCVRGVRYFSHMDVESVEPLHWISTLFEETLLSKDMRLAISGFRNLLNLGTIRMPKRVKSRRYFVEGSFDIVNLQTAVVYIKYRYHALLRIVLLPPYLMLCLHFLRSTPRLIFLRNYSKEVRTRALVYRERGEPSEVSEYRNDAKDRMPGLTCPN